MKKTLFALSLLLTFLTSACSDKYADGSTSAGISKANGGAILGGVAGGVAGHQFGSGAGNTAATVGGVALGALAGHAIGDSMDSPVDKAQYSINNARSANTGILQETLEYGQSGVSSGFGQYNGRTASITPMRTYTNNYGQNCRDYTAMDQRGSVSSGTACRQADGFWR